MLGNIAQGIKFNYAAKTSQISKLTHGETESGIECPMLKCETVRKLQNFEIKLDGHIERFLQFLERYNDEVDHNNDSNFNFKYLSDLYKFLRECSREIPLLDCPTYQDAILKLSNVINDQKNIDDFNLSINVVTFVHDAFHDRVDILLGAHNCPYSQRNPPANGTEISHEPVDSTDFAKTKLLQFGERGVQKSFELLELMSRYFTDITKYIEKKLQLDSYYCTQLNKISSSVHASMSLASSENFLPLWESFSFMNLQDKEFCKKTQMRVSELQGPKFLESLKLRKLEFEDIRTSIRESWIKEERIFNDTLTGLKRSKDLYWSRQNDVKRLQELLSNSIEGEQSRYDRRKKQQLDEAELRCLDAERRYRDMIDAANFSIQHIVEERKRTIDYVKSLILQGERKMQSASINYFHSTNEMYLPRSVQYKVYLEQGKRYTPGTFFKEQLHLILNNDIESAAIFNSEKFTFEEVPHRSNSSESGRIGGKFLTTITNFGRYSESEMAGLQGKKPAPSNEGGYILPPDVIASDAAKTHSYTQFSKQYSVATMCLVCNGYPYNDFIMCKNCKFVVHSSCLEGITHTCNNFIYNPAKQLKFFRTEFEKQPLDENGIPVIVTKCIDAMEKNFLDFEGIYRREGGNKKVQELCQLFEELGNDVNLTQCSPHDISQTFKHYLKELPQPLLTFDLYSEWVDFGNSIQNPDGELDEHLKEAQKIIEKLPSANCKVLISLLKHIRVVIERSASNKMGLSNMAVVFAPTLLRPVSVSAQSPKEALLEVSLRTGIIEFLIENQEKLFQPKIQPPPSNKNELLPPDHSIRSCSFENSTHSSNSVDLRSVIKAFETEPPNKDHFQTKNVELLNLPEKSVKSRIQSYDHQIKTKSHPENDVLFKAVKE